jgi:opacity protein-like surface antigen
MKKILCALIVLAAVSAAVFAEEWAGEKAGALRDKAKTAIAAIERVPKFTMSAGAGGVFVIGFGGNYDGEDTKKLSLDLGGGGYAFLDVTFAELSVGYSGGRTSMLMETGDKKIRDSDNFGVLDVSLLGKYPIALGKTSLFSMFGASYQHVFSPEAGNIWRIQFGGGMDYKLSEKLYLRGQALFGVRLPWENDDGLDLHADYRTRLAVGYIF